jgi:hypothetical protein
LWSNHHFCWSNHPSRGWGPQDGVQLPYKWQNPMDITKDNYSIHGVYKLSK